MLTTPSRTCFVILFSILFGTYGCQDKAAPPSNSGQDLVPPKTEEPKKVGQDLRNSKPDATMTAEELTKEFAKNSGMFLTKYNDKVIEISGPFEWYDDAGNDRYYLLLGPGINKFECDDKDVLSKTAPGQTIKLRGRCVPGLGIGMWTFVGAEGPKPATYTPDELVKAFTDNRDAMEKKLKGKTIWGECAILTGKIQEVDMQDRGTIYFTKADASPNLTCYMLKSLKDQPLKAGQTVRVLGHYNSGSAVTLSKCVILNDTH